MLFTFYFFKGLLVKKMICKYWLRLRAGLIDLLKDLLSIKKKITDVINRIVKLILHIDTWPLKSILKGT